MLHEIQHFCDVTDFRGPKLNLGTPLGSLLNRTHTKFALNTHSTLT